MFASQHVNKSLSCNPVRFRSRHGVLDMYMCSQDRADLDAQVDSSWFTAAI